MVLEKKVNGVFPLAGVAMDPLSMSWEARFEDDNSPLKERDEAAGSFSRWNRFDRERWRVVAIF